MHKKRVLFLPNSSGSSVWRGVDPFSKLNKAHFDTHISTTGVDESLVSQADVVVMQSVVDKEGIAMIRAYQQEKGLKVVCDADDYLELNPDNPYLLSHEVTDATFVIKKTMEFADKVTTTTPYLAEHLKKINSHVEVLPNYMNIKRWEVNPKTTNTSDKIRIGWVGSHTHFKDFESIAEPLKRIMDKYPVKLILMGDIRLKELFPGYDVECMLGVPFEYYPKKLSGLALDIGLAPLLDNEFNRCKSNIKCLEYGINAIPVVASDVEPYRELGAEEIGVFLANGSDDWYNKLEYLIKYPEDRRDYGQELHKYVKTWYDLEKHISKFEKFYDKL